MSISAATPLSNEVFQEDWSNLLNSQTKETAKISYLMVEKVTPPEYMWDKISAQLDAEESNYKSTTLNFILSKKQIIALLIAGATAFIFLALYLIL